MSQELAKLPLSALARKLGK